MNQLVGKRYFGKDRLYYRKGAHDYFEVNKQPNTIRIFCFGESTTAGFPYEYNAIPTEFLRERLNYALPGKNVEVINTAIAAINSFTINEFAKELVHYSPDLFIVYMGHNEFYGVYGVGSTISVGKNRWIIKTYLWLQQFKTFLLLKNIINSVSGFFKSEEPEEDKLLMEQMVQNNSIGYNSSDYEIAMNNFKENYKELIETAKENNIPILISTLVVNERNLSPFVSMYSDTLKDTLKKKWELFFNLGIKEQKKSNYQGAINYFNESLSIDSTPAKVHYELGKCYEELENYKDAEKQYSLAGDLDGLRFRAPSEFNSIIKTLAYKTNVPLTDVNKEFKKNSIHGIVGSDLLVDHVHPNIKGYFLLSKSWFKTIEENKLLGLSPDYLPDDSLLWQQSAVTSLDSVIGALKIIELKNKPPFQSSVSDLNFKPKNFIEEIAYQYTIKHDISWGTAHLNTAKIYFDNSDFTSALKEFRAILTIDEGNPVILKFMGDMYFQLKIFSKAEETYLKAFSLNDNQFIKYKLGLTELNLGKPLISIQYLNDCLASNNNSQEKFTPAEIEDIHYSLALSYYQINNYQNAFSELQTLLKINPSNEKAIALFKKIKSFESHN